MYDLVADVRRAGEGSQLRTIAGFGCAPRCAGSVGGRGREGTTPTESWRRTWLRSVFRLPLRWLNESAVHLSNHGADLCELGS